MAKSITKRSAAQSSTTTTARRPSKASTQPKARAGTKQSTAIAMLRSPRGTTIDGLMKATGWQQHSVRGFLAGVVRKRLCLNLDSSLVDGRRVYRVTSGKSQKAIDPSGKMGRRRRPADRKSIDFLARDVEHTDGFHRLGNGALEFVGRLDRQRRENGGGA